jgi:hypothetical protein
MHTSHLTLGKTFVSAVYAMPGGITLVRCVGRIARSAEQRAQGMHDVANAFTLELGPRLMSTLQATGVANKLIKGAAIEFQAESFSARPSGKGAAEPVIYPLTLHIACSAQEAKQQKTQPAGIEPALAATN